MVVRGSFVTQATMLAHQGLLSQLPAKTATEPTSPASSSSSSSSFSSSFGSTSSSSSVSTSSLPFLVRSPSSSSSASSSVSDKDAKSSAPAAEPAFGHSVSDEHEAAVESEGKDGPAQNEGKGALLEAVEKGNLAMARSLLDGKSFEFIGKYSSYHKPLDIACGQGHVEMAQLLLAHGARPDVSCSHCGSNAASYAIENGHVAVVSLLLDRGVHIVGKDVIQACEKGHVAVMTLLLDRGVQIRSEDVCAAFWKGHLEVMRLLLDRGVQIRSQDVNKAFRLGKVEVVRLLLDRGFQISSEGANEACENGHEEVVRLLLDRGVPIRSQDVLEKACENDHVEVVRLLLDRGVQIRSEDVNAACGKGHVEVVRLLLDRGVQISSQDLYAACKKGWRVDRVEAVRLLLDLGFQISSEDVNAACKKGCVEVVRLLLDRGVQIRSEDVNAASENGCVEVVRLLLDRGVQIRSEDVNAACENGCVEVVRLLLDRGVQIRSQDVYAACKNGWRVDHVEVVRLLLDRGFQIRSEDVNAACENGHEEVVRLLLDRGVQIRSEDVNAACGKGHVKLVRLLLDRGFQIRSEDVTAACEEGRVEIVRLVAAKEGLIKRLSGYRSGLDWKFLSSVSLSSSSKIEIAKLLLQSVLQRSVSMLELAKLFVEKKVAVSSEDLCQFLTDAESIKLLLESGANVNGTCSGGTPLYWACHQEGVDHVEISKLFLESKADVDRGGEKGSPLKMASSHWRVNFDLVKLLLEYGASREVAIKYAEKDCLKLFVDGTYDVRDSQGWTLLMTVANKGDSEAVRKLCEAMTAISTSRMVLAAWALAQIGKHWKASAELAHMVHQLLRPFPLLRAVFDNQRAVTEKLLLEGADVNSASNDGSGITALMLACLLGNVDSAELLLGAGADFHTKDCLGRDALFYAEASGSMPTQNFLRGLAAVPLVNLGDLSISSESLGVGSFGKVLKATLNTVPVAVKISTEYSFKGDHYYTDKRERVFYDMDNRQRVFITKESTMKINRAFIQEAILCAKVCSKPGVVGFLGACLKPGNSLLVFDLVEAKLPGEGKAEAEVWEAVVLRQAAQGLWSLHQERILHRDVARRNLLKGANGAAFLCDFGYGATLPPDQDCLVDSSVGDFLHMPPECLSSEFLRTHRTLNVVPVHKDCLAWYWEGSKLCKIESEVDGSFKSRWVTNRYSYNLHTDCKFTYTPQSDIFSFGILMWELLAGSRPYPSMDAYEAATKVLEDDLRPEIPVAWSAGYREIMQHCWQRDPSKRPGSMLEVWERLRLMAAQLKESILSSAGSEEDRDAKKQLVLKYVLDPEREALDAANDGHVNLLKALMHSQDMVETQGKDGRHLLHLASARGNLELVEMLLDGKADLEAKDLRGYTALMEAVSKGHIEVVRLLVAKGASLQIRNLEGEALLQVAAKESHTRMVQHVIWTQTQNLQFCPSIGEMEKALNAARARAQAKDAVCLLLDSLIYAAQTSRLLFAVMAGADATTLELLMSQPNEDVNFQLPEKYLGLTPLLACCQAVNYDHVRNFERARLLIEAGADVRAQDSQGRTALGLAISSHSPELQHFIQSILKIPVIHEVQIEVGRYLDEGNFGKVYLAEFVGSNHAVKIPENQDGGRKVSKKVQMKTYKEFLHEAVISSEIGSKPNVVPFRGGHLSPERSFLVYEFIDYGSVEKFLSESSSISLSKIASILTQAATGLWSLHAERVIHRDVASRNFLIDKIGRVFICDFGLSCKLLGGQSELQDVPKGPFKSNAPESLSPFLEVGKDTYQYQEFKKRRQSGQKLDERSYYAETSYANEESETLPKEFKEEPTQAVSTGGLMCKGESHSNPGPSGEQRQEQQSEANVSRTEDDSPSILREAKAELKEESNENTDASLDVDASDDEKGESSAPEASSAVQDLSIHNTVEAEVSAGSATLSQAIATEGDSESKNEIETRRESKATRTAVPRVTFSFQSDIYMFGIFMWECFARKEPYPDMPPKEAAARVLKENLRPTLSAAWPQGYRQLMQECWHADPSQRPKSMGEVTRRLKQLQQDVRSQEDSHVVSAIPHPAPNQTLKEELNALQASVQEERAFSQELISVARRLQGRDLSGCVEQGTVLSCLEETTEMHHFALDLLDKGVELVIFDMDKTMTTMHSSGAILQKKLSVFKESLVPGFLALYRVLQERGLRIAVATHADSLYSVKKMSTSNISAEELIAGSYLVDALLEGVLNEKELAALPKICLNPKLYEDSGDVRRRAHYQAWLAGLGVDITNAERKVCRYPPPPHKTQHLLVLEEITGVALERMMLIDDDLHSVKEAAAQGSFAIHASGQQGLHISHLTRWWFPLASSPSPSMSQYFSSSSSSAPLHSPLSSNAPPTWSHAWSDPSWERRRFGQSAYPLLLDPLPPL